VCGGGARAPCSCIPLYQISCIVTQQKARSQLQPQHMEEVGPEVEEKEHLVAYCVPVPSPPIQTTADAVEIF